MSNDVGQLGRLIVMLVPSVLLGVWVANLMRIRIAFGLLMSCSVSIGTGILLAVIYNGGIHDDPMSAQSYLYRQLRGTELQPPLAALACVVGANLAIALTAKVYRAVALDRLTDAERSPGVKGVRAWLAPLNVISVIVLAMCAYCSINYSYVGVVFLGLIALLLYPLIGAMSQQKAQLTVITPPQAPADERQRVLALVEAGKITAEDAAELMSALAQSQVAEVNASVPISGPRRAMIAGALAVLVGFMLPWFSLNTPSAMDSARNMVQQMLPQMPQQFPGGINLPRQTVPVANNTITHFELRGGDIHDGLGWIILAAALCAAVLPFFWTARRDNAQQQHNTVLISLAVGSVAVLYLLTNSFNPVTLIQSGFMLVMTGYSLLWFGAIRENIAGRSALQPALAAV